ncbi:MarR family winged helix-turn-helix transcriptional regulator [Pedomonas mirosovicensis]|uniref:MarR family winged helix-turn-helix transcriptional regulator n=1 Tax=Pedomonas mirosovicensis TaxID=2908641 RepID=UPI002168D72B|nr:MarR family transcriptional regulator [Pedomonas mirosovicensis]MCH8684139.1 MarR family transcriptional regulator [Pedomonas mirosovicensis]
MSVLPMIDDGHPIEPALETMARETAPAGPQKSLVALAVLLEQTVRLIYPERSPQAMHPGQWAALRYLARANREAATVAGLARYLGVTLAPASRAVSALIRKGFVKGEPDSRDRRIVRLSLTPEGEQLIQQDPILRLAEIIGELPAERQHGLTVVLEHVFERLGQKKGQHKATNPFVIHS